MNKRHKRHPWAALATTAIAVLLLASCAGRSPIYQATHSGGLAARTPATEREQAPAPRKSGKTRPYTVMGQTYRPLQSSDGYSEEGLASWYGRDFHGKPTANGEMYDMYKVSAAHKLLPLGSRVRVTNLENGKTLNLTINDRGPFVKGRIIDLSYEAAKRLGTLDKGVTMVRVESIGGIPGAVDGNIPGPFYIQVGSFSQRDNAEKLKDEMLVSGYRSTRLVEAKVDGSTWWRVQAGEFKSLATARLELNRLALAYPEAFVVAR